MTVLPYRLDRTVEILARPETVFRFFTEDHAWAAWWGKGSTIDPRPGGRMLIRHPNGIEASGEVLEVRAPELIVFTYGYVNGAPSPPGSSRVTIRLNSHPRGTLLQLTHEFADAGSRDEHVQGWRYQLALFANLIADTVNTAATDIVDRWFAMWGQPDAAIRNRELEAIGCAGIRLSDKFSCIDGDADLREHLAAVQRFMPGVRLERSGTVRHCQWHVLADWVARGADGSERGRGTNLFVLDGDGRIASVIGFWAG